MGAVSTRPSSVPPVRVPCFGSPFSALCYCAAPSLCLLRCAVTWSVPFPSGCSQACGRDKAVLTGPLEKEAGDLPCVQLRSSPCRTRDLRALLHAGNRDREPFTRRVTALRSWSRVQGSKVTHSRCPAAERVRLGCVVWLRVYLKERSY